MKIFRIFFTCIFFIFLPRNFSYSRPLALDSLEEYAKSVSIGIQTPSTGGSGFIIGKRNNKYFFITAGHVISSNPKTEEYWVYSLENPENKYRVNSIEKPKVFSGKDIVIGSFYSTEQLGISLIFPMGEDMAYKITGCKPGWEGSCIKPTYETYQIYKSFYHKRFDNTWKIQGDPILAGIAESTRAITVPLFRSSVLNMKQRALNNQQGYEALYGVNTTNVGMSGSGVFGTRVCPVLRAWGGNISDNYPGTFLYSKSPSSGGIFPNPPNNSQHIDTEFWRQGQQYKVNPYTGEVTFRFQRELELLESQRSYERFIVNRTREYPGVIAMHGMSEEYRQSGSKSGIGLGIPLTLFKKFFRENSKRYGIPNEKEYFKLVYKYCF